jgi:hypothetical protein
LGSASLRTRRRRETRKRRSRRRTRRRREARGQPARRLRLPRRRRSSLRRKVGPGCAVWLERVGPFGRGALGADGSVHGAL